MKRQLLLLAMILMPLFAMADAVEIDGIFYNLNETTQTAEVTNNPNAYSGSITLPENIIYNDIVYRVTSIDKWAFEYCSKLTSITIPESITSIGELTFQHCSGLTSVTIPNSVTSIGYKAFWYCSNLASINIPNSVTSIGALAFDKCSSLVSINIPNSVTSIEAGTFRGCSSLASITIPDCVTSIGSSVFSDCESLTSIIIPNSVTSIGGSAFAQCTSLTSFTIPDSVTSIGDGTFSGCSSLASITIPNRVTTIGQSAFSSCSSLVSITLQDSITSIGAGAFRECSRLASITIPNHVTTISYETFLGCSNLTTVTIGNGIILLNQRAFVECENLTDVYCYAEKVPGAYNNVFPDFYNEYTTLHVPAASIDTYKATVPWKNFKQIVAIDGETPTTKKCATPTISYSNKKLSFSCETDGAEFVYEITDSDIKKGYENSVDLSATYEISVYATKTGYDNSDVATATLVWTDAMFTLNITTSAKSMNIRPLLIQANNGIINIQGVEDGERICVYSTNGIQQGSGISHNSTATINTHLQPGDIAIVKVGIRAVKIVVR